MIIVVCNSDFLLNNPVCSRSREVCAVGNHDVIKASVLLVSIVEILGGRVNAVTHTLGSSWCGSENLVDLDSEHLVAVLNERLVLVGQATRRLGSSGDVLPWRSSQS